MKINERTLIQIAKSSDIVTDQNGWLFMKTSGDKKKRWCVLKENLFFYYENKNDKEPLGLIVLEGHRVEIIENVEDQFSFRIDFGKNRFGHFLKCYEFAASDHQSMERWVKVLSCASYDYLIMAVSELQHRLNELNLLKTGDTSKLLIETEKNSDHFDLLGFKKNEISNFLDLHENYGHQIRKYFEK